MEDNINQHRIDNNVENSKEFYTRKDIASVRVFVCKNFIVFSEVHLAFFKCVEDPLNDFRIA